MAFELIIVVCIGLAAAGVFLLAARLLGWRGARKVVPLVAALAMVGYQVWSRYTWAERTVARLPEDSVVIQALPKTSLIEPWTLLRPMTGGLVVIDRSAVMTHPDHPHLRLVTTRLVEQYEETLTLPQLVDCGRRRRALTGADDAPLPEAAAWIEGGEPAMLYDAVCPR
ncbi:hypothetical protein [Magnetospirillum sp. UT-4]|uniref:hypothetical protein n=1 Tax=Magnetospirillum sp. UT-4 TaxID=2681467 RepID=UPI00137F5B41|nr:hypothetical protein [Magnetospirillum sp. UT-4]CAA7616832.1 conserved exported hypothetical protein [Magnetospirillum sp. UT-4]